MARKPDYTAEQMIEAIQKAEGNLAAAARIVGCARSTMQRYVDKYVTVNEALDEEREKALDEAENQLMLQVRKGNMTAIIFFLKTVGKHRGYVERQEVTGADGGKLQIEYVNDWRDNSSDG